MLTDWPDYLIIGNSKYTLRLVKKLPKMTLGICDTGKKEILILEKLSTVDRAYTLLHEIVHAIEAESGVRIEHGMVYLLEKYLGDVLIANDFLRK